LSAEKLKKVYDIASPRIRQYLEAELNHVLEKIHPRDNVIELGCGYGRILPKLAASAKWITGIDTSISSLMLAKKILGATPNCSLYQMDASRLGFRDHVYDCVVCVQNGISAFQVDQMTLISESMRVTKPGGMVMFSTYSEKFWNHRLQWFQQQSERRLLGEIDYNKTSDGVIVCKDGFTSAALSSSGFRELTAKLKVEAQVVEIDESSLFCEIIRTQEGT
jgi:2-polyprenyl-6-hydroxyphenyl methylase/3-demethylubiquinone-9 3-methyltransferase